jgi:hypothetical protein
VKFVTTLIILLSVCVSPAGADELAVSRFDSAGLTGWESKNFKGLTEYHLLKEDGRSVVKASSSNAASGLIRKMHFQPSKFRYLRWSWKIADTVKGGDERVKNGDDYAARIYVIFPGAFFWQTKALVYIWANRLPQGESAQNVYTANARMIAVESGNGKAGLWLTEERDLYADYRHLFGTEPPMAEGVAIMTDTDNTGGTAEAWYGEILLSTAKK